MRRVRMWSLVCAAAVAALAGCGPSVPGPTAVANKFFEAMQQGNVAEAMNCLQVPPGMDTKFSMVLAGQIPEVKSKLDHVEVLKETINGDQSHVNYRLFYKHAPGTPAPATNDNDFTLNKVDGKWRIALTQ